MRSTSREEGRKRDTDTSGLFLFCQMWCVISEVAETPGTRYNRSLKVLNVKAENDDNNDSSISTGVSFNTRGR